MLHGILTGLLISLYTVCHEVTKASHLDGLNCQCHLWNLLGRKLSCLHLTERYILPHWSRNNENYQHHGVVQFCCQPVCICPLKPKIQGNAQENDVLLSRLGPQSSSHTRASENRACRQEHQPSDPTAGSGTRPTKHHQRPDPHIISHPTAGQ